MSVPYVKPVEQITYFSLSFDCEPLNRHEFLHAFLSSKFEFENIYSGVNFYEDIIIILLLLLFYFIFFSFAGTYLCVLLEKMQNLEP